MIHYIICAAGKGERFRKILPLTPKPLIKINNKTSLELAIFSLPISCKDVITIITKKDHCVKSVLFEEIKSAYPVNNINWIETDDYTTGQLTTALLAKSYVSSDQSVVIFNCDTYFQDVDLFRLMQDKNIDGLIPCFDCQGDSWSFCRTDENNLVLEVAEKKRISENASVGFYFFRDSVLFFDLVEQYLTRRNNESEHFVIPIYQEYIKMKKKIYISNVNIFRPMGTPDQLSIFWGIDENILSSNNINKVKKVILCDLDNTITIDNNGKSSILDYINKTPNDLVIEKLREYKKNGFEIIIYTSRRMKTKQNNEALVIGEIAETTLNWLKKFNVPFDGIRFGKPFCENGFIIDDKAIRPKEFVSMTFEEIKNIIS